MSSNLQQLLAIANEAQESTGIDMNEAVVGGGGGRLLPVGYAFAQLVEYIELGMQPQDYQGTKKDPALEVVLGFALTGQAPDPANPGQFIKYNNDDGTPYIMRPYSMALSRNEKSRAFKLFKALNYKGTAKSFGQLLGQKWLVKIVHEKKSKTDEKIVSRLDLASFLPPLDPVSGQPYPIQDAPDTLYKLFSWAKPTLAAWDSLFVEGMYEAKDGKPAASKNRTQETILGALDFDGSPLQGLLLANGKPIPAKPAAQAVVAAPVVPTAPAQPGPVAAPVAPAVAVVPPSPTVVAPASTVTQPSPTVVAQPTEVAAPLAQTPVVAAPPGIAVAVPPAVPTVNVVLPA